MEVDGLDTKFGDAFDTAFKARGVPIVNAPICTPTANFFAESWIGGMKRECLNHFMCFSLPVKQLAFEGQFRWTQ